MRGWTFGLLTLPGLVLLGGAAAPDSSPSYSVALSETDPAVAEFELQGLPAGAILMPARGGEATALESVRCGDDAIPSAEGQWTIPAGCTVLRWRVRLADQDRGLDASLPPSSWSARNRFWFLAERHGWLRAQQTPGAGTVTVRVRRLDGRVMERRYPFPSADEPPFYAAIGAAPARVYSRDGFRLEIFGHAPDFPWMDGVHEAVLSTWARWRRDLVPAGVEAPMEMALAWLPPPSGAEPGYGGSAGATAIGVQIVLREGDPDAEAKARAVIAAGAAHEGFHSITGAGAQAWPAWVNESLANHFAIEAARTFLEPADFAWIRRYYVEPRMEGGLLAAQAAYAGGDGDQRYQFYTKGARFWAAVERVLTVAPNGSGRLAALIQSSNNFEGVNLNDGAAIAAFLDRHSGGAAAPLVDCFLVRPTCDAPEAPPIP